MEAAGEVIGDARRGEASPRSRGERHCCSERGAPATRECDRGGMAGRSKWVRPRSVSGETPGHTFRHVVTFLS